MSDAALRLDDFSYSYPGSGGAGLARVSLRIERGEFVLVCGESGSGKSTLLRAAAGLVPHHFGGAARGEAAVCGKDLREHHPGELATVCGTVLQDPEVQVVMGSVRHELAFPLENLGRDRERVADDVVRTARSLGIEHLLDRRTSELSGGELQRVVIAAALVTQPPLLALDEPTAQLDPGAADELLDSVLSLNRELGVTVLLAEHRIARVLDRADRVIAFERGELSFDGDPRDFREWSAAGSGALAPLARAARAPRSSRVGSTVLACDGVSFRHRGAGRPTLDDVSLELRAGERVALAGPNGSGKSTLLRLMRGLVRPDSGSVDASGDVALLMQNPNDYLIHERVADEAPVASLSRFGLEGMAGRDPRDLSGGERQRLALAIVTQVEPSVLLLDEPTRGMDRTRRSELAQLLAEISASGCAVVVATHDREFAAAVADREIVLERGRVIGDATVREPRDLDQPAAAPAAAGVAR